MASLPYMPMFWDAYIQDTDHLSYEEHGLYLNLIRHLWCAPDQRIPNDDAWLARKFRMSEQDVRLKLRKLVQEYCSTTRHYISQRRVTEEFKRTSDKLEKQRERAKARWEKEKAESHGNARAAQQDVHSNDGNADAAMPLSYPISSVPNGTAASAADGLSPDPNPEPQPDLKKLIYDRGKALMGQSAGGMITKALAKLKLGVLAEIIDTMESVKPVEPKAWFQRAVDARLQSKKGATDGYASAAQY